MPKTKLTLTYNGETKTLKEWSKIKGIGYDKLKNRVKAGYNDNFLFVDVIPREYWNKKREKRIGNRDVFPYTWTSEAVECYEIGCRCSRCTNISDDIKPSCRMKYTVRELVKRYGKPGKDEE